MLVDEWLKIDNNINHLNRLKLVTELQIAELVNINSLVNFCNTGKFLILEENAQKRYD
ncbi:MAG: hypothetical protein WC679_01435 [Bacteroidales bacterium]